MSNVGTAKILKDIESFIDKSERDLATLKQLLTEIYNALKNGDSPERLQEKENSVEIKTIAQWWQEHALFHVDD